MGANVHEFDVVFVVGDENGAEVAGGVEASIALESAPQGMVIQDGVVGVLHEFRQA
jgi:hypothetical protein